MNDDDIVEIDEEQEDDDPTVVICGSERLQMMSLARDMICAFLHVTHAGRDSYQGAEELDRSEVSAYQSALRYIQTQFDTGHRE